MLSGRTFAGKRLPLTVAFTLLLVAAFGAGCKGFFTNPNLTSITINPTAPSVEIGASTTLSAYGVYSDGSGSYLDSGVSWSTSDGTIATVTGSGGATLTGVGAGTATITASSESVSSTATATVFLGSVTNFQVCEGTFGATTSCSSGANPLTWTVSGTNGGSQTFIAQGTSGGQLYDLTTQSTWTLVSTPPTTGSIDCTNTGTTPETCTVANPTSTGTYDVTVSYPTTSGTLTATLAVKVD